MIKKTEAIILRHRHFGDTSLILTFYSKDAGKIDGLAKGIKKNISRGEGGMEIFSQVELIYYEKELKTLRLLSQWYLLNSFRSLRTDLLKFAYASYIIELVNNLIHGEERNEKIYYLLLNSLELLENEEDLNRLIHFFEIKFINLLGYGLREIPNSVAGSPSTLSLLQFLEKADFKTLYRLKMSKDDEEKLNRALKNYLKTFFENKPFHAINVIEKLKKL